MWRRWRRQSRLYRAGHYRAAGLGVCLLVSGCVQGAPPPVGVVGHVQGHFGGAVSDEPRASLVAGGILSAGGTAADAAVALYFALSVTYPSAASLGGGGACVVHDVRAKKTEALDFTVAAPSGGSTGAVIGVPGSVRGMFALHARYGRLRWNQVVLPAENLARFGAPASRATVRELARGGKLFAADRAARLIFVGRDGRVPREGQTLPQVDLAATLGRIRAKGAGEFYSGLFAKRLVAASASIGGGLRIEDLRKYRPVWRPTLNINEGSRTAHFVPDPIVGGVVAARLWEALEENGAYKSDTEIARDGSVATASIAAYRAAIGAVRAPNPTDHAVASFAVVDSRGGAVSCSVTLNGRFGAGRILPGTGIVAARPPRASGDGRAALASMLIVNKHNGDVFFAAGGSGNGSAPTSLVSVALRALHDEQPLEEALAAPRIHAGSAPGAVFVEPEIGAARKAALRRRGFRPVGVRRLGRINAIHCPKGLFDGTAGCAYRTDLRGSGFAATAER